MSAGGAWQAAQHDAWYQPFAKKMGITFNEEVTDEGLAKVQAMVQAGNVPIDLVTVETATVLQGGDTGVLHEAGLFEHRRRGTLPARLRAGCWHGNGCVR